MSLLRPSLRLLAPSISKTPITSLPKSAITTGEIGDAAEQLLPPLQLYKRLLRVHKKVLPIELRVMGDEYVKAEFRRTRTADNPLHIVGFLSEWKKYLDFHEAMPSVGNDGRAAEESAVKEEPKWGKKLDPELFERLSSDQIGQLYELMQATKEVYLTPEEVAARHEKEQELNQDGIPNGEVLPDLGKK